VIFSIMYFQTQMAGLNPLSQNMMPVPTPCILVTWTILISMFKRN